MTSAILPSIFREFWPLVWDGAVFGASGGRAGLPSRYSNNNVPSASFATLRAVSGRKADLLIMDAAEIKALIENGFTNVFHIDEGFEGERDEHHHRSTLGGWRFRGLPWEQC